VSTAPFDERGRNVFDFDYEPADFTGAEEYAVEVIEALRSGLGSTMKFACDPPASAMSDDDTVYRLCWGDVHDVAAEKALDEDLTSEEMHVFRACLDSGLSCWSEVVELALMAATSERSEP